MLLVELIAWLASVNALIPSDDTNAYCQARSRLPKKMLQRLFGIVAQNLENKTTKEHLWCGVMSKWWMGQLSQYLTLPRIKPPTLNLVIKLPVMAFLPLKLIGVLFSLATGAAVAIVADILNTRIDQTGSKIV